MMIQQNKNTSIYIKIYRNVIIHTIVPLNVKHQLHNPQFSTRTAASLESQLPSQAPEVSSTWRVTIGNHHALQKLPSRSLTASPWRNDGWKTTLFLGCYIFRGELLNFQGVLRNLAKIYIESWEPPKKKSHPIALVGCIEILIMAYH